LAFKFQTGKPSLFASKEWLLFLIESSAEEWRGGKEEG